VIANQAAIQSAMTATNNHLATTSPLAGRGCATPLPHPIGAILCYLKPCL